MAKVRERNGSPTETVGPQAPGSATGIGPQDRFAPVRRWAVNHESELLGLLGLVTFLALWEIAPLFGIINPLFSSSPSRVFTAAFDYLPSEMFRRDLSASASVFGVGFAMACAVGIPLGLAMGWYRRFGAFLDYVVTFGYASPRIAIIPLLILWFGIGHQSKIALVFIMAIFPIIINTMTAVRTIDATLLRVAASLNANSWQLFRTIIAPASVPAIVSGVRLGIGVGLIGVVVAEFMAATRGLGYRMHVAATFFNADLLFVALLLVAGSGVAITELLKRLEGRLDVWRQDR